MPNPNNQLRNADSPYLLQHKDNPVNWYQWGDEALKKAQEENKLVIISIGYAACHWCHVMEHESFEDTQVAAVMNKNYVSIKVDREQRPDIDNIYMTAAQIVTGRGGWPLNVIALPNGKPVYAGTYFPKENWIQMLKFFAKKYEEDREKLIDQAEKITEGIGQVDVVPKNEMDVKYTQDDLDTVSQKFHDTIDLKTGGRRGAPKFPMPDNWQFLMAFSQLTGNSQAEKAVTTTLDEMAKGGIYDHIGGGFARYSTDAQWHVPHFEKMLYDNGQLVSLYSRAYQWTSDERYKQVVYETLNYIDREMTSEEGGFYSSLDADSEGEEGKFYVWTDDEIKEVLGEDADLFMDYYDVTNRGNWEHGKNVLRIVTPLAEVAEEHELSESEAQKKIENAKAQLFEKRSERVRPGLDDKILTSWNALMMEGYTDAYLAFKEERFLETARKNANFLRDNMIGENHHLKRNYKNGNASIDAFLDDYALLINAYVKLYQATFDEQWLDEANGLAAYAIEHFYDEKSGMFYYTEKSDTSLIARKMEVSDNVIPSSNSAMANALFKLGHYYYNQDYLNKADQMLDNVQSQLHSEPTFFSNWARLMLLEVYQPYEVAITGPECHQRVQQLEDRYLPNVLYLGAESESNLQLLEGKFREETTIFVCQDKVCQQPVTEVSEALKQMNRD